MTHLLVTGASGLLGINLALLAAELGYQVTGWTYSNALYGTPFVCESVNLTDTTRLQEKINALKPDLIINCAALANVDSSQKEPLLAARLNTELPRALAEASLKAGSRFVHISTDAVFDGTQGNYKETDTPNPLNIYAQSKLLGEQAVQAVSAQALIARVVFYGWSLSGTRSLAEFFYNNLIAQRTMAGYTDMYFTPLYVEHLAAILLELAEANASGVYHVFGADVLSKYAFGVSLALEFGLDPTLVSPRKAADETERAARSLNLSMNTTKLRSVLKSDLPGIAEGLKALHLAQEDGLREQLADYLKD